MRQLVSAGILMLCATVAGAQTIPRGDDFQVNTLTATYEDGVDVGMSANGDFVVVWHGGESTGSDTSDNSIQARRYTDDGTPLGVEFQVNTFTLGGQLWPAVSVAPSGAFVIVWVSYLADDDSEGGSIQGQRFSAVGTPVGSQFQVNTFTANGQGWPDVDMDPEEKFTVVWESYGDTTGDDSNIWSIQAQRFSNSGQPLGGQFQVNTYTTDDQRYAKVAAGVPGDFIVVWQSYGSAGTDGSKWSVQGQRFASNGAHQGEEFQVNTTTTADQYRPDVAMDSAGNFVVVWQDNDYFGTGSGKDGDGAGIVARRFSAPVASLGDEFIVNAFTTSWQSNPALAFDTDNRLTVVWDSDGSSGSDESMESIQAKRYAPDGAVLGTEFQVNSHTPDRQYASSVTFGSGDRFVVAWASYSSAGTDDSGSSTQARRFFTESVIFVEGFDAGDFGDWIVFPPPVP